MYALSNRISSFPIKLTLVLMFVIFLIAHPSPDLRCLAATTHPYAPCPSSFTNWYSESTTKLELSAVNECLCMIVPAFELTKYKVFKLKLVMRARSWRLLLEATRKLHRIIGLPPCRSISIAFYYQIEPEEVDPKFRLVSSVWKLRDKNLQDIVRHANNLYFQQERLLLSTRTRLLELNYRFVIIDMYSCGQVCLIQPSACWAIESPNLPWILSLILGNNWRSSLVVAVDTHILPLPFP